MTLRIAKLEEHHRKGRMPAEKMVTVVSNGADPPDPEPEVVGIPGLVREMIGRFSCHDFDGVTNGCVQSKQSLETPKASTAMPVKSSATSFSSCQLNSQLRTQNLNHVVDSNKKEIEVNDKQLLSQSALLLNSRHPARTRVHHSNTGINQINEPIEFKFTVNDGFTNADMIKNLAEEIAAPATTDASNASGPPFHPKSNGVLNSGSSRTETYVISSENADTPRMSSEISKDKHFNKVTLCLSAAAKVPLPRSENHSNRSVEQSDAENPTLDEALKEDACNDSSGAGNRESLAGSVSHHNRRNEIQAVEPDSEQTTEERDGHYFLGIMKEVEFELLGHCNQLEHFLAGSIPDEAAGRIRAAIGKSNLLITKKFKQFRELCQNNLTQAGDEQFTTTSEDLSGFWDLVQIQVDDVRGLFREIYELQKRNWIDVEPEVIESTPSKAAEVRTKEQTVTPTPKKPRSSRTPEGSKAREEARKRLMAAKMAGRQRIASETEDDIQIFIS